MKKPYNLYRFGNLLDTSKAGLTGIRTLVPTKATVAIEPVIVLTNTPEARASLRDKLVDLIRDQERRSDEGWEPGIGDLADEYLDLLDRERVSDLGT